ncbi:MAG: methyltransferase domain-containing protein [Nostoc sp. NOS(2021)]|uniref:class I SAM-dependent methyltransferase n=1 Tax=Nostoc sp. NOS(2021) TaxID=2815407 RepID=UPI0025CF3581|nr:methyltransferase domain-containing protein [Nostoc sp. NOS(2021)]MBN3896015.1 methyltransferase domain-containing protein [Nostoc sp. NOS(2021)]
MNSFTLADEMKLPCQRMSGLAALKTRYRPFICPLDLVLAKIPEGARLYDIGCGTGALLYLALKLRSVKIAHGYDISPLAVKAAAAFGMQPEIFQVIHLSPEETPPDLHGYDTVTMIDVLHHIPAKLQDDFLRKTIAQMDSGARLIIKDIEASKIIGSFMNQLHDLLLAREWVHQRRSQDIVQVLQSMGATVSRPVIRWTFWYPHFQIVILVP